MFSSVIYRLVGTIAYLSVLDALMLCAGHLGVKLKKPARLGPVRLIVHASKG